MLLAGRGGGAVPADRSRCWRWCSATARRSWTTPTPGSTCGSASCLRGGWSLAHPGALSSFATEPWLPTQWSTEMLAARMEDWFGLSGVAWLFGALFLLFIVAVYAPAAAGWRGRCQRAWPPALAVVGATPALSARPQVVSLVLLAVVVASWLRSCETLRAPWHLVPLTWVWATAHGLWTTGLVVGVVCCAGILLDRRPGPAHRAAPAGGPGAERGGGASPRRAAPGHLQLAVGARASLIVEWGPPPSGSSPPSWWPRCSASRCSDGPVPARCPGPRSSCCWSPAAGPRW